MRLDRAKLYSSKLVLILELVLILFFILGNLGHIIPVPSIFTLFALAWISLWFRKVGWRGVGLKRPESWKKTLAFGFVGGVLAQTFTLYILEPFVARFTGNLPDVGQFESLKGNILILLFWLALSWTVAAFGEELVFRGYLLNCFGDIFNNPTLAKIFGLIISSILFGIVHLYQGFSGIISTGIAGLFFGILYIEDNKNLWPAILAHGVMDTCGFILIFMNKYPSA